MNEPLRPPKFFTLWDKRVLASCTLAKFFVSQIFCIEIRNETISKPNKSELLLLLLLISQEHNKRKFNFLSSLTVLDNYSAELHYQAIIEALFEMEVNEANLQTLGHYLETTLNPEPSQRRKAEKDLEAVEGNSGLISIICIKFLH